jgi:hypothetical protein
MPVSSVTGKIFYSFLPFTQVFLDESNERFSEYTHAAGNGTLCQYWPYERRGGVVLLFRIDSDRVGKSSRRQRVFLLRCP